MIALCRICATVLLAFWLPFAAWAQTNDAPDFDRWTALAERVEALLDSGNASEEDLTDARASVDAFRSDFDPAREANAARIVSLREQIAALGPVPDAEAGPESAEVAAQREALNAQLAPLLAPVQRAEAAFVRADSLISQIDQSLRERQAEQLLTLSPTPLNPAHWPRAIADLLDAVSVLLNEPAELGTAVTRQDLGRRLPQVVILGALGLVLLFRGRRWSRRIVERLQDIGWRGFGIWRFIISLLRIILPFLGLVLIALAAIETGLFGPKVAELLFFFAILSGFMFGIRWVSERLFSRDDDEVLIALAPAARAMLRFHVVLITIFIAANEVIAQILLAVNPAPATLAVLTLPLTLLAAVSLYRIGVLLRGYQEADQDNKAASELRVSTLARLVRALGTGAVLVAIVAPLLLAAGYTRAADALLPPYFMTLTILGLTMVIQRFSADIYGAITGKGLAAREALVPVIIGMVLLLAAVPVLALTWGARVTDLTEMWSLFERGFAVGESRISPMDFLAFLVIFGIGYAFTRIVQSALRNNVLPKTQMDIGGQNAVIAGLGYIGIFLAALAAITGAGIDLSSIALVAGALSVGIGFGLQTIVSNFVSGIILLVERPISEGDWIEVGGQMGYVRDISVRSTRIETFDRTDVIVPNADLVSGTVTNYTRGNTIGRLIVPIGVAYGTDTKRVEAILREIAEAQPMVLASPPPTIVFMNFGADALEFEIRCILRDVNWMLAVKSNINHAIAARFQEEGIEIPFAQRDLWLRNPEVLAGTDKGSQDPEAQQSG